MTVDRTGILDGVVQGEVVKGARVEHRDATTAILRYGRKRRMFTVTDAGHVEARDIAGERFRWGAYGLVTLVFIVVIWLALDWIGFI